MSSIKKLEEIKQILKKEFIGLDKQIDKIINLMAPWYIDQDLIDKPIIINLWGMTGSGKTSLVRRIASLVECTDSFFEIDLGKFTNKNNNEDLFKNSKFNSKPMFLIDEFQSARKSELETDSPSLRNFWSFLNDGKIILNQKNEDFSKSLIFIAGNVIDAFENSKNLDNDLLTTDELHRETCKILVSDIKTSLLKILHPEEVSRLGSNHIIFNSLNKKNYQQILENYINKVKIKIQKKSKSKITFTKKIKSFILEEGIISSQGVRSFESAFYSMVISKIPYVIDYSNRYNAEEVVFDYDDQKHDFIISFFKNQKRVYVIKDGIIFETNKKRNELHAEPMRSYIAYHEAGHAVVGYLVFNKIPTMIRSKLLDSKTGGVVKFNIPDVITKSYIINEITCLLGGFAAEKLIFGKEKVSVFSGGDLQQATKEASDLFRLYGMGDFLSVSENDEDHPENIQSSMFVEKNDEAIEDLLQECFNRAEDLLIMNSEFHKEVAEILKKQTHLSPKEFKEIAKKYEGNI